MLCNIMLGMNTGVEDCNIFIYNWWIKDAPLMDETTDEDEVSAFTARYATCQIPDPTLCSTLHEGVMKFQQHKCNNYCLRSKKTKTGF